MLTALCVFLRGTVINDGRHRFELARVYTRQALLAKCNEVQIQHLDPKFRHK
jgi:hypothetical protein